MRPIEYSKEKVLVKKCEKCDKDFGFVVMVDEDGNVKKHDIYKFEKRKFCDYCRQSRKFSRKSKKKIASKAKDNNNRIKKYFGYNSFDDVPFTSIKKYIKRENVGCFICNWKDVYCDFHHIIPYKDGGKNVASNVTYICPNCHRKVHLDIIKSEELKSISDFLKNTSIERIYEYK